jgi:chemotaxis protein histidine kinase CheA
MLNEIKRQFFAETIKKLDNINIELEKQQMGGDEQILLAEEIFFVSHQLSGTGPMLGFQDTSKISRKLERTFYDIRQGQREITPQVLWQTKRAIEAMIKTFYQENDNLLAEVNP